MNQQRNTFFIVLPILLLASACGGSSETEFAGDYTVSLTNRENGCDLDDWVEGQVTQNVSLVVTQGETTVTGQVEGLAGLFLSVFLGTTIFTGDPEGDDIELRAFGETAFTSGNCTYTFNGIIDATLAGDFLSGEVRYEAATNNNPDCEGLTGCVTRQEFNGTRPPPAN